jgi:hypothetical protein
MFTEGRLGWFDLIAGSDEIGTDRTRSVPTAAEITAEPPVAVHPAGPERQQAVPQPGNSLRDLEFLLAPPWGAVCDVFEGGDELGDHHGDTPSSGRPVTSVSVVPYTTSVDVNIRSCLV